MTNPLNLRTIVAAALLSSSCAMHKPAQLAGPRPPLNFPAGTDDHQELRLNLKKVGTYDIVMGDAPGRYEGGKKGKGIGAPLLIDTSYGMLEGENLIAGVLETRKAGEKQILYGCTVGEEASLTDLRYHLNHLNMATISIDYEICNADKTRIVRQETHAYQTIRSTMKSLIESLEKMHKEEKRK